MWRAALALLVALSLSGPATAGPLEDGWAAYATGDYATAVSLWRPMAEQGYADAQFSLGVMYASGLGVPLDYAEAARWHRLAAEQGFVSSQNELGRLYQRGHQGLPQDYAEAVRWYRRAADQGYAAAQFSLGNHYNTGLHHRRA